MHEHPKQGSDPSGPTPVDNTSASLPDVVKRDTAPAWIAVTREDAANALDEFAAEAPVLSDDFAEFALETGADQPAVASAMEVANDAGMAATLELSRADAVAPAVVTRTDVSGVQHNLRFATAVAVVCLAIAVVLGVLASRTSDDRSATNHDATTSAAVLATRSSTSLDEVTTPTTTPTLAARPLTAVGDPAPQLSMAVNRPPRAAPPPARPRATSSSPARPARASTRDSSIAARKTRRAGVVTPAPPRRETSRTLIQPPAPIVMADMRANAAEKTAPSDDVVAPPIATSPSPPRSSTPTPSALTSAASDDSAIAAVLERYRSASSALDADAVVAVWPTSDARGLTRAFNQLISQEFSFRHCFTGVNGSQATSFCQGRATYVPRVGNKNPRVESREWLFGLHRDGDRWVIDRVTAR